MSPRLTSQDLRRLWEGGRRREAIRGAFEGWERLLREENDLHWLEAALRSCGLHADAFEVQIAHARRNLNDVRTWGALIRSVLDSGDPRWARQLLEQIGTESRELQGLRIETELVFGDVSELVSAWLGRYRDPGAVEAAVGWWVRSGHIEAAEQLLEDSAVDVPLWRARLALWRRQPGTARAIVRDLPSSTAQRCLEAIAAVLEDRLPEAESILRALVDGDVRAEAWTWLATVLRKERRYAEAARAADAAALASPRFNLVARLERTLADAYVRAGADRARSRFARRWWEAIRLWMQPIGKLEHAPALYALGLRSRDSLRALEALIERFAGNHSDEPTLLDGGKLSHRRLPIDPRHLGASLQRVLWTRGPDAARALYEELAASVNDHPLYRIYHGELELWLGEYERAAMIFRAALARDRRTRWAWIGLGASAMLQGDLREAQKIWRQGRSFTDILSGFAGPTLYVYRGECHRRQGNVVRARRDLEQAIRQKPERLSAQINLALLDADADEVQRVHRLCVAAAPVLMEELHGSLSEQLEQVLEAMRGNRSSSPALVSYHLWGRIWRRAA